MTDKQKLDSIRREIFTYLAGTPQTLNNQQANACVATALNIGNFLCWVAPLLETGHHPDQPVTEIATSIAALGKQFRQVSLRLWEQEKTEVADNLMDALNRNRALIDRNSQIIQQLIAKVAELEESQKKEAK